MYTVLPMSLIKRGRTWHTRLMFDGKLYQQSLRTHSKDTATKLEAVFRSDLVRGEFGIHDARKAPTLAQFETRMLPHLKANTAPRTYGFYKQNLAALNRFAPLAQSRLHKIDESMIEQFIQFRLKDGKTTDSKGKVKARALTATTVNHSLRTLKRALILAKDWNIIRDVPRIRLLPGEHEREYVIEESHLEKMTKYIAAAYPTSLMRHMLPFLVDTGLRISEACGLKIEHVTFENGNATGIRIVKGKSRYAKRDIPLTTRAGLAIAAALKQSRSEFVFTSKSGKKPLTRHYPSQQFRTIRDAIGIGPECVLHSCRHTFCTRLGKAGADAFTIQKLAGHSSITVSQRYVHADREIKEAAIGLLNKLNEPKPKEQSQDTMEI
jgi:integrase